MGYSVAPWRTHQPLGGGPARDVGAPRGDARRGRMSRLPGHPSRLLLLSAWGAGQSWGRRAARAHHRHRGRLASAATSPSSSPRTRCASRRCSWGLDANLAISATFPPSTAEQYCLYTTGCVLEREVRRRGRLAVEGHEPSGEGGPAGTRRAQGRRGFALLETAKSLREYPRARKLASSIRSTPTPRWRSSSGALRDASSSFHHLGLDALQ